VRYPDGTSCETQQTDLRTDRRRLQASQHRRLHAVINIIRLAADVVHVKFENFDPVLLATVNPAFNN
jgi:hypothetical protein